PRRELPGRAGRRRAEAEMMAPEPRPPVGQGRGTPEKPTRIFPFGVSRNRLEQAIEQMAVPAIVVRDPREADAVLTLKNYFRRRPQPLRDAEARGVPIYVLRSNTTVQMANLLRSLFAESIGAASRQPEYENGVEEDEVPEDQVAAAMYEAEEAIGRVLRGAESVDLRPQVSWIRRLQHQLAERYNVASRSRGREPYRYVEVFRRDDLS
ncbi:MAG: AAA family ATPase, partial [Thermomicrobiaceae bacterium]|nr:AAA family ATPase [Thermomicrobiaceae bacterium]